MCVCVQVCSSMYMCVCVCVDINFINRKSYLPTPPLGQDMTEGQLLSGV